MVALARIPAVIPFLLLAALASAQSRPSFSGTWSQTEPPFGRDSSHVEQIELRDPVLKIKIHTISQAGPFGSEYRNDRTYAIGGPAETSKDQDGRIRSVTVTWDGPALVFVRTTQEGANTTTERTVWTLSDDGQTLTKSRETASWQGTARDKTILKKQ